MRVEGMESQVRRAVNVLIAVARGIFDEAAYARFLERTGQRSSRRAYAAFLKETEATRARRPRCC